MIYIAVLCNSTESLQNRSTILPLFIGPYAAASDGQSSDILVKELILVLVLVRFSFINYSFYSNSVLTLFLVLVFIQFYKNNFSFSSYLVLI